MSRLSGETEFSLATSEDRLVWIFGSSRSGSTWLLRMLSELDGAVPVDDPHLGHHLGVWRPIPLAWSAAERQPRLTTLLELKRHKPGYLFSERYRDAWAPALRQLIVSRFDAQVREALQNGASGPSPFVVVKEPGSHVADLLLSLFPLSRMIFLLRDGRDVVDSWLAAHRPGSWAVREGAFPVAANGREALVRWQSSVWTYRTEVVQRAYDGHDASRRITVRYEGLLRKPARELERICASLGLRAERQRLEAAAAEHAYTSVPGSEKGNGKEIRAACPGGWRRNLSASEQGVMYEVMGDKLSELGYRAERADQAA
jgi:sulfotransferase family protein